jgi:hypothetical protein
MPRYVVWNKNGGQVPIVSFIVWLQRAAPEMLALLQLPQAPHQSICSDERHRPSYLQLSQSRHGAPLLGQRPAHTTNGT